MDWIEEEIAIDSPRSFPIVFAVRRLSRLWDNGKVLQNRSHDDFMGLLAGFSSPTGTSSSAGRFNPTDAIKINCINPRHLHSGYWHFPASIQTTITAYYDLRPVNTK